MHPLAIRSVLATTDLSEASAAAVATASALARLTESRLTVLHVSQAADAVAERRAVDWLRQHMAEDFESSDVRIIAGKPADTIIQQAERAGADVIVLGPHRERSPNGRLGSTADAVVRRTQTPCLVVPTQLTLPLRRVLVPIDLSESACGALLVGFSWASALRLPARAVLAKRTEVRVLHVAPSDNERASAQATLHEQVESIHSRVANGVRISEIVEEGADPAPIILQHVSSDDIDLAVLSTRGRSHLHAELLGSVSSAVVRNAPTPVLLVPPGIWRQHAASYAA